MYCRLLAWGHRVFWEQNRAGSPLLSPHGHQAVSRVHTPTWLGTLLALSQGKCFEGQSPILS